MPFATRLNVQLTSTRTHSSLFIKQGNFILIRDSFIPSIQALPHHLIVS